MPGAFRADMGRRIDAGDWAEVVIELMTDERAWKRASRKARALAERHTWDAVLDRWEGMLAGLARGAKEEAA